MKRLLRAFLFVCSGPALSAVTDAAAQTYPQNGVVRMITTSASSPVTPVAGVRVAVGNNVSKATAADGAFRLDVTEQFNVNGVLPDDEYELALPTRGKTYHRSRNDLDVVVITKAQKAVVSKKVYDKLQSDYKQKIQELQAARDEANARVRELKKVGRDFKTMERQRDSLQKLMLDYINNISNFEEKFDALSEQLAITDYRSLSEKERRVYEMQIDGDWEGLTRFYNEIMHGDMEHYLKDAVTFERRAAKLKQQAEDERKVRFQDALNHIEALKMRHLNDSVSTCYRILTDAAPDNWNYLNDAGAFEWKYMADYFQALAYHEQALRTHPADSLLATSYNNIGTVYYSRGDCARALDQYNKALHIFMSVYGENHPSVAASCNNIGGVYSFQGDYPHALEQYEKALKILLPIYGENHPDVAMSYDGIGVVYYHQGHYASALEQYEKALKIWLSVYGENNPHVATSYNNIGTAYNLQRKYTCALERHEKALKIRLSIYGGENHPDVATSYNNIGVVYHYEGDFIRALEQYEKALKIRLSIYGENHPHVATSYNNIGTAYNLQRKYTCALERHEKALKIRLSIYGGENHPDVAMSHANIAYVYCNKKDYVHAMEHFEKALRIFMIFLPEDHPDILQIKGDIEFIKAKLQQP